MQQCNGVGPTYFMRADGSSDEMRVGCTEEESADKWLGLSGRENRLGGTCERGATTAVLGTR